MTDFEFSIRGALKRSWGIFTKHALLFVVTALVVVLLNVFSQSHHGSVLRLLVGLASLLWSYMVLSMVLSAVDGKEEELSFHALKEHLPTFRNFLRLIGVSILSVLVVGVGFVALVLPGIYFLVRFFFSNLALVDRQGGVTESMRYSWHLIKGDIFWTALLVLVIAAILMFAGLLVAGIGILVTYPLAMILVAIFYRSLTDHHAAPIVEQPKEIEPATK